DSESVISELSVSASVLCITSSRGFSSPVTNGASNDKCLPELARESVIFSTLVSRSSASSSGVGGRSNCFSSLDDDFRFLFIDPTWLSGKRTILDWSATADNIDWRIHQTAYDMNLNPLVSSKRLAALIKPRLP